MGTPGETPPRGRAVITKEPIEVDRLIMGAHNPNSGAMVTFLGIVRDDGILSIEVEAFEDVAQRDLEEIHELVGRKYPVHCLEIIHRTGQLAIGETILLIVVSSSHRKEAFSAFKEALEAIKARAAIWKKEYTADGGRWIKGNLAHEQQATREEVDS
ncbi:MAG: molybdenum cofactor biosynthesis protein MoaE [Methanomicrobiales archaeon]|nr:molybdenum cofactor biosynthesis protein MoaE [Methanomicrobiales archaeon]